MENDKSLEEKLQSMTINENEQPEHAVQTELPNYVASNSDNNDEAAALENRIDLFVMRTIAFFGNQRRIVMQSANGPCPLIALANCLVLKGKLTLPAGKTFPGTTREHLSCRQLKDLVGGCVLEMSANLNSVGNDEPTNYETILNDVLDLIPRLDEGLEVNVQFSGVTCFEYTPAISLFDLLGIRLYHTWVVEPGSGYEELIGNKTYNQVTALAFEDQSVACFLEDTQSQMTYTGLIDLVNKMADKEIAVLFRNNHFHTVLKIENFVHVLCTDIGFVHQPNTIWEVLQSIEGDTRYVNSQFKEYQNEERPTNSSLSMSDYELAKQLDAQYNGNVSSPEETSTTPEPPTPVVTTARPPDTLPLDLNRSQTRRVEKTTPKTGKCNIS